MSNPIVFTDSAASKVGELIAEEGNDNLKLRVYVSGGGVQGFNMALLLMKKSMKMIPALKTAVSRY